MNNLVYLLIALGLSVSLSLVVWLARYRKPTTFMSSIDSFRREMDALGREVGPRNQPRNQPPNQAPSQPPNQAPNQARRDGASETDQRPER
jgi:hypothetical protein